jgi:cysteine-rich repeat protein
LYIGHEERLNADSYFNGDIGSVQIFTVPLTATAVDVLYAKELPTYIYCGDGEQNGNEQCDDGNQIEGDGCSAQCTLGLTAE